MRQEQQWLRGGVQQFASAATLENQERLKMVIPKGILKSASNANIADNILIDE